ncbi:hypothetical protein RN11_0525 [Mycobacterium tuberculosis]|nr:hypothetical protein RN11_0525 [Mycobacterium tuberculosis]
MLTQTLTPAIYRTTISHCRQVPVHHSFAYRSYSWYVDVDNLPSCPGGCDRSHGSTPTTTSLTRSRVRRIARCVTGWTPSLPLAALPSPTAVSPRCCKHAFSAMSSTR